LERLRLTWAALLIALVVVASVAFGAPDFYRKVREKGEGTRSIALGRRLLPERWEEVIDFVGYDVTLQHLEFATDGLDGALALEVYRPDGTRDTALRVLKKDGKGRLHATPRNIHEHESICWSELVYDTTNNYYKFGLGYPVRFANGARLLIGNLDTAVDHYVYVEAVFLVRS